MLLFVMYEFGCQRCLHFLADQFLIASDQLFSSIRDTYLQGFLIFVKKED